MRIVYLCSKHPPFDGRIHFKISPTLINGGHEVVNIHPNIEDMVDNGITLIGFKQKKGSFGRLQSLISLFIKGSNLHADILIAPEPDSLLIAYLIKKINKKTKVIFDCHEWYNVHFTHVAKLKNKTLARLLNWLVTYAIKHISARIEAVIAVNDTMKEYFEKQNKNSYTIPSLMDQSYEPNMFLERKDYIYFGQFGNGGQEEILLDAARILKKECSEAKIVVIGGYRNTDCFEYLNFNEIIKSEKLQDHIELKGWLQKDTAFLCLNTGLAGIMRFDTTYYNGLPALPNKVFEYMSLGMALICSKQNVELKKIVDKERCGITIETETGHDLAKAITYLQNNKDVCLDMGNNGLKAVQEKYNWLTYGIQLNQIIEDTQK